MSSGGMARYMVAMLVSLGALLVLTNGCDSCPKPPEGGTGKTVAAASAAAMQLVIEDDHVAAWGPISNWFSNGWSGWDPNSIHWKGVLIQLGAYKSLGSGPFIVELFEDPAGSAVKTLKEQDFVRWINLTAMNGDKPDHARNELDLSDVAEAMTMDGACALAAGFLNCPVAADDCQNRTMSLHRDFLPQRVLTLWPGTDGYVVATSRVVGEPRHIRYTFDILNPVRLDIDGVLYATPGTIKLMKISTDPNISPRGHMDSEDPPWPPP